MITVDNITHDRWGAMEVHFRRVPFLSERIELAGIAVGELSQDTLEHVPFTHKAHLRASSWKSRAAKGFPAHDLLRSSGTSGAPTVYAWSRGDLARVGYSTRPLRKGLGLTECDVGAVWAPTRELVMGRCMAAEFQADGLETHLFGTALPSDVAQTLADSGVTVLKGLPKAVSALADCVRGRSGLRQVHVGGDLVTESQRRKIELQLECGLFNFYGLSEVYGPIAAECSQQDGLHLSSDVLVELISPEDLRPVPNGSKGVAVFTTLWNKTSPVLRYWSEDVLELMDVSCPCGSTTPLLRLHGRYLGMKLDDTDLISRLSIEEALQSHLPASCERELHIRRDHAELRIAPSSPDLTELLEALEDLVGGPVRVSRDRPLCGEAGGDKTLGIIDARCNS